MCVYTLGGISRDSGKENGSDHQDPNVFELSSELLKGGLCRGL